MATHAHVLSLRIAAAPDIGNDVYITPRYEVLGTSSLHGAVPDQGGFPPLRLFYRQHLQILAVYTQSQQGREFPSGIRAIEINRQAYPVTHRDIDGFPGLDLVYRL